MATSTAAGKKRMTQSDVINYFAERTGMKRAQVKQLFEDLGNLATSEVKSNGEFVLRALEIGSFRAEGARRPKPRNGRNDPNPSKNHAKVSCREGDEGLGPSEKVVKQLLSDLLRGSIRRRRSVSISEASSALLFFLNFLGCSWLGTQARLG